MAELSQVKHVRILTNGIHLHCAVAGGGPLLVMLHGFPEFWGSWSRQIAVLDKHFTVVAPDLRGFGESDKPRTGYDAATLAADIVGVIDAFAEGQRARIVGHDWGGEIAWALSYLCPEKIDRLSILNSPHPCLLRKRVFTSAQLFRSWYVLFCGIPILPNWYFRRRGGAGLATLFRYATAQPDKPTTQYITEAKAEMLKPGAIRAGLEYYRTTVRMGKKGIEFMKAVTDVPTQIIWGEEDPALGLILLDGLERYSQFANTQIARDRSLDKPRSARRGESITARMASSQTGPLAACGGSKIDRVRIDPPAPIIPERKPCQDIRSRTCSASRRRENRESR